MKIKVSVIVPVYNVEKYINKCLDSLVNQTLKDIEIIVVNDGTPDNSQKIIDKYVKKYPNKVKSFIKENGGLGSARNFGMEYAKGEYISFVDSDDWIDFDTLKKMYDLAKKEKSDIVICDMIEHYSDHNVYHNCTRYSDVFDVSPSACNKIFRRKLIHKFRFLSNIWYEDLNFMTKLLFNTNRISTISIGFYHYNRGHESTMSNNNSLKNLDIIYCMNDIITYSKKCNLRNYDIICKLIFNHILIDAINRVAMQNNEHKKEVLNKLVKYCRDNISNYESQEFYQSISRNRKIIAWLNYHKMYSVSRILLKIKENIKR